MKMVAAESPYTQQDSATAHKAKKVQYFITHEVSQLGSRDNSKCAGPAAAVAAA